MTFTVPVWDDFPEKRRRRIGVLGTSANIGGLINSVEGTNAWLVDMRENDLLRGESDADAETELRGLLLQHPRLSEQSGDSGYPRLADEDIKTFAPLVANGSRLPMDCYVTDPLSANRADKPHAAVKPITIDGRGREAYRTKWLVVAVE